MSLYIRIKRNGCWMTVGLTTLTDSELRQFAAERPKNASEALVSLVNLARDNIVASGDHRSTDFDLRKPT